MKDNMKPSDYEQNSDCHPFWHIRRSNCVGGFEPAVVEIEIEIISSTFMKEVKIDGNSPLSCVSDFTVTVPCISNTEDIAAGAEIVLK